MAKTELFAQWLQSSMVIEDQSKTTGNRYFVCSTTGTDSAGYGKNPDSPVATLDYAISNLVTASKGDIIYVMPGHAESITTATALVMDVAGVTVQGLGSGSIRPTFTIQTNATASVVISAANVTVKNILFVCGTDGINGAVTLTGNDCLIEGCEFRDATDVEADVWLDVNADRLTVRRCFFNGYTGGDQQEAAIDLDSSDACLIEECRILGKAITAAVNISVASTNLIVRGCDFLITSTTDLSKTVVDTATGSTWEVVDCFDLAAGAGFSGGSGGALAKDDVAAVSTAVATIDAFHDVPTADATTNTVMRDVIGNKTDAAVGTVGTTKTIMAHAKGTLNQANKIDIAALGTVAAGSLTASIPHCVEKSDGAVPSGTDDLFTIAGGPVFAQIYGLVTTVLSGTSNAKLQITTTTPSATVDLNAAAVAIDNDAAGTVYYNVGATSVFTPAGTLGCVLLDPVTVEPTWLFLAPGTVKLNSSGAATGVIKWYMRYIPLSPNSLVTAAA